LLADDLADGLVGHVRSRCDPSQRNASVCRRLHGCDLAFADVSLRIGEPFDLVE